MGKIRQQLETVRRLRAEQQRADLVQAREDKEAVHEFHQDLAHKLVSGIAERTNQSGLSPEALEKAVSKGLDRVDSVAVSVSPTIEDPDNRKLLEDSKDILLDHLSLLMKRGVAEFIDGYRGVLREENNKASEVAAEGIRTMARQLGIETSLRAEYRRNRSEQQAEVSGSQEYRR